MRQLERESGPPVGPDAKPGENPVTLIELVHRARNSEGQERVWLATLVNQRLARLKRLPDAEQLVTFFLEQLDDAEFGRLTDKHGWPCRAAVVEAIIELGYPHALQLDPDDVEYFTQSKLSRPRRLVPARLSAALGVGLGLGLFIAALTAVVGRRMGFQVGLSGTLVVLANAGLFFSHPAGTPRRVFEVVCALVLLGLLWPLVVHGLLTDWAVPMLAGTAATLSSAVLSMAERRLQPR